MLMETGIADNVLRDCLVAKDDDDATTLTLTRRSTSRSLTNRDGLSPNTMTTVNLTTSPLPYLTLTKRFATSLSGSAN